MPSMTSRKMRRKKNVPEARYTMAVVKLMETLLRSAITHTCSCRAGLVISCELRAVTFCGSSAAVHLKWVWNRKFENILKEEQSRFHSGNKNYLFNSFFLPLEQRRIKSNVLLSPSKKREKSLEGLFCWYGRCLWLGPVQPQTLDRWVSAVSGYLSNAELIFSSNDPQHISKYIYLLLKAKREGH